MLLRLRQLRLEGSYAWPEPGSDEEPERGLELWLVQELRF